MLTKKQYDLLNFIHHRTIRDGVPPSFDEMKEALDLRSKSGIHRLITALEERGFIRRLAHRARAIEIVRLPDNMTERPRRGFTPTVVSGDGSERAPQGRVREARTPAPRREVAATTGPSLPIVGRIAAGAPIEAIERADARISAPEAMLAPGAEHFALEVRGDSMVEAGINDGDVVVIRAQDRAETGDIVVALIHDHEATLKRLKRKSDGRVALEAANPAYETRIFGADQVRIQGKLVGLIRVY